MHKIDGNTKVVSKHLEFFEDCIFEYQKTGIHGKPQNTKQ